MGEEVEWRDLVPMMQALAASTHTHKTHMVTNTPIPLSLTGQNHIPILDNRRRLGLTPLFCCVLCVVLLGGGGV